jgi:hypothetical protein
MTAGIAAIRAPSAGVTEDIGRLNTDPKQTQRMFRRASKVRATPTVPTDISGCFPKLMWTGSSFRQRAATAFRASPARSSRVSGAAAFPHLSPPCLTSACAWGGLGALSLPG